ncbi:MAG: lipoprotein signal peptidase [Burkholderiaceae bacterium]|nr:lipoprotein signal peptidase [Burkholderiaceae bacterium]
MLARPTRAPLPGTASWLARWLALAGVVIVIDQMTKQMVLDRFSIGERVAVVTDWFDITLAFNPGAAFSFLADAQGWQRWLFVAIGLCASALMGWLIGRHRGEPVFSAAMALIIGGAIGNVIDRLVHGQVVDFLLVHHAGWFFPAFNVADSSITLGAILLILDEFLRWRFSRATTH